MKLLPLAFCIGSGMSVFAGLVSASLTFDEPPGFPGLLPGGQVLSFYDGGFSGDGSGPGPAYGVSFTNGLAADSVSIIFGRSARLTAPSVTMNLNAPWNDVVSFYFLGSGTVAVYSGPNASGILLLSSSLTSLTGGVDTFAFGFSGFQSVVFSGEGLRLDSITFGELVIPEPSGLTLLSLGIVSLAGMRRRSGRHRPRPALRAPNRCSC